MVLDDDLSSQTITSSCFTNRFNNWPDASCACLETSMACVLGLFILLVCSFPLTRFIWVGLESEYQYQAPTTVPKRTLCWFLVVC